MLACSIILSDTKNKMFIFSINSGLQYWMYAAGFGLGAYLISVGQMEPIAVLR